MANEEQLLGKPTILLKRAAALSLDELRTHAHTVGHELSLRERPDTVLQQACNLLEELVSDDNVRSLAEDLVLLVQLAHTQMDGLHAFSVILFRVQSLLYRLPSATKRERSALQRAVRKLKKDLQHWQRDMHPDNVRKQVTDALESLGEQTEQAQVEIQGAQSGAGPSSQLLSSTYSVPKSDARLFQHLNKLVPSLKRDLEMHPLVAIVGTGGLGKTTLAEKVFGDIRGNFDRAVFLTVGKEVNTIQLLLKTLHDLFPEVSVPLQGAEALCGVLAELLKGQKVLLVLDGVWDHEHLRSLNFAKMAGRAQSGNRVVVTTRNPRALGEGRDGQRWHVVQPQRLTDDNAQKLLLWHAFGPQGLVPEPFWYLAATLAQECHGLPLLLKVIGSCLRGEGLATWRSVLKKLQAVRASDVGSAVDTSDRARIGFEALAPMAQQCFMTFSAFPEDMQVDEGQLLSMWAAKAPFPCSLNLEWAQLQLEDLIGRGLIEHHTHELNTSFAPYTVSRLVMHDILRGIAVHGAISSGTSLHLVKQPLPSQGSNLLDGSFCKILEFRDGQAQWTDLTKSPGYMEDVHGWHDTGDPAGRELETHARQISLHSCGMQSMHLVAPNVKYMVLDSNPWVHVRGMQDSTDLEFLSLQHCSFAKVPLSFSRLLCLQGVHLRGCEELLELPGSICELQCLEVLDLFGCKKLTHLPDGIGALLKLQQLVLGQCTSLTSIPDSICKLTGIRKLDMFACESVAQLPSELGRLTAVTELRFNRCKELLALPTMGRLLMLKRLDMSECKKIQNVPAAMWRSSMLVDLRLQVGDTSGNAAQAGSVLDGPVHFRILQGLLALTQLTRLSLRGFHSATAIPESLGSLQQLQELWLLGFSSATSIPDSICSLTGLQQLYLEDCSSLTAVPAELGDLVQLVVVDLSGCSALTTLPASIGKLTRLQGLYLNRCSSLAILPQALDGLVNLHSLYAAGCVSLKKLPEGLGNLKQLHALYLKGCLSLVSIPASAGELEQLQVLDLTACSGLASLPATLGGMASLQVIDLSNCTSLVSLPESLNGLQHLQCLYLQKCASLKNLPASIGTLTRLQWLYMEGCKSVVDLPDSLGGLEHLQIMDMRNCVSLAGLPASLGDLAHLQKLKLSGCSALTGLPDTLSGLVQLQQLDLRDCTALTTLPASLTSVPRLSKLHLGGCTSLSNLPDKSLLRILQK